MQFVFFHLVCNCSYKWYKYTMWRHQVCVLICFCSCLENLKWFGVLSVFDGLCSTHQMSLDLRMIILFKLKSSRPRPTLAVMDDAPAAPQSLYAWTPSISLAYCVYSQNYFCYTCLIWCCLILCAIVFELDCTYAHDGSSVKKCNELQFDVQSEDWSYWIENQL